MLRFTATRCQRRRRLVRSLPQPPACGACSSRLPSPAQLTAAPQQGVLNDSAMLCFTAARCQRRRRLVRPLPQPPSCGACASQLPSPAQATAALQQRLPNDAVLYCDAMPAHAHAHARVHACVRVCVHTLARACTRTRKVAHMYAFTHTRARARARTHTCASRHSVTSRPASPHSAPPPPPPPPPPPAGAASRRQTTTSCDRGASTPPPSGRARRSAPRRPAGARRPAP